MKNYKLLKFKTLDSTNTYALKHLEELEDRTVIISEVQTCGRGRFQREWVSESARNLYTTIVLKPQITEHTSNLTQYMCVVLTKVLEKYNIKPQIKWPNDVQANNAKIAGILCEASLKGNSLKGLALGLGVNLNMTEHSLKQISQKCTSLNILLQKEINTDEFFNLLLEEFFENYELFLKEGFKYIKKDYIKKNNFLGRRIFLSNSGGEKEDCFAQSLNDDGNLIIIDKNGMQKTIYSGDIHL